MDMVNLLAETIESLAHAGKCPKDVEFVKTRNGSLTWDQFATVTKDFEYNCGYGTNKICMHLKIVGDNWWLERHEYDGMENWEYKTMPQRPDHSIECSDSLSSIQNSYYSKFKNSKQ